MAAMEAAGYGTSALDPNPGLRMDRPATAPATIEDIDAIFQKLNSAMATSNQLIEAALTPTPDGLSASAQRAPLRATVPQRAASVSMCSSVGEAEAADWSAYDKKLRRHAQEERPPSTGGREANRTSCAAAPDFVVAGHSSASVPMDLLDELASLSLCEDFASAAAASQRLSLRSPANFANMGTGADAFASAAAPAGGYPMVAPAGISSRPASVSIWGNGGITPPRTPETTRDPEPVLAPAPQPPAPAPAPQSQLKPGRGRGGRPQHQLSPTQTRRADGESSPPAAERHPGYPAGSMFAQPQVHGLNMGQLQGSQMLMPQLMQSDSGQQGGFSGLPTGLPVATVMNINGVPQLVALLPQQYQLGAGQGLMPQMQQPGLQGGLLSPQQQLQQLHALAQQQAFPYHNSLPVVPSGWGDTNAAPMPGSLGGFAPSAAPPGGGSGWQGGGVGTGKGGGKHEPGGSESRHPKRVAPRGRETRTIEEASEAGALRELAHDQHGCRFLQDQLDLRHKPHVDLIFEATKADAVALSMDPFGNYLVQKLVQYGTTEQRGELIELAASSIAEVALNVHGTRVVQKMVECADTHAQKAAITAAIIPRLMELIRDMNANHVIQRCLAALPPDLAAGIYDRITAECLAVATHRHGCCVLQRCLDHADPANRDRIIAEVVRNAAQLVVNPFGNYVVQYILDLKQQPLTRAVVHALQGGFAELSLQKFSSNVIEKCLKSGDQATVRLVAEELTAAESFPNLLHDPFANYVIQTLLTIGPDDLVGMMVAKIQPHLQTLRSTLYGKRIQAKLLKRCPNTKVGGR